MAGRCSYETMGSSSSGSGSLSKKRP
jgi:hypothetical protein